MTEVQVQLARDWLVTKCGGYIVAVGWLLFRGASGGNSAAAAGGQDGPRADEQRQSAGNFVVVVLGDPAAAVGGSTIIPSNREGPTGEKEHRGETVA